MRQLQALASVVAVMALPLTGVQAQSQPSETDWDRKKLEWALFADEYQKKCKTLSDFHGETASRARKHYAARVDAAGLKDERAAFVTQVVGAIGKSDCSRLQAQPKVKEGLDNLGFLADEYLLAVHYSGLNECGTLGKASMAKLLAHLPKVYQGSRGRPDLAFIDPVAKARGEALKTTCSSIVGEKSSLLYFNEVGGILLTGAAYFNGLPS